MKYKYKKGDKVIILNKTIACPLGATNFELGDTAIIHGVSRHITHTQTYTLFNKEWYFLFTEKDLQPYRNIRIV